MKKSLTYLIIAICSLGANAQSNLSFFTEDGQRFHVIINGEVKNSSPLTKVKIENLPATNYQVKIKFEEDSLGEINRNMPLEAYKEYTFKVKRRNNSAVGSRLRKMGRQVSRDVKSGEINNEQEVDGDVNNKYALKFVSELDLTPPPTPVQPQKQTVSQPNQTNSSVTQTTTTSTTTTASPQGGNISMNVNVSGMGTNVDMNSTDGYYEETTTVTTTTNGTNTAEHYVMPGYNGAIGCPWPMQPSDFSNAKASIASKDFSDTKLTIAKQVTSSNCLFSDQVKEIMLLFDFEDAKLDYAKYAYGYTYDLNNYYLVNNAFDFESSIEELNNYIGSR